MSRRDWRKDSPTISASSAGGGTIILAIRLADQYRHRPPKLRELMDEHGMSEATAYRWLTHFKNARDPADGC